MDSEGQKGQSQYPHAFLELLKTIANKRANVVLRIIMDKGFVTTEDLATEGYEHAPRAARDVRELGIPLITFNVKATSGKSIAAYKFGDLTQLEGGKGKGRIVIPKEFKEQLYKLNGGDAQYVILHTRSGIFKWITAYHMRLRGMQEWHAN